jgi:hypothetical protein
MDRLTMTEEQGATLDFARCFRGWNPGGLFHRRYRHLGHGILPILVKLLNGCPSRTYHEQGRETMCLFPRPAGAGSEIKNPPASTSYLTGVGFDKLAADISALIMDFSFQREWRKIWTNCVSTAAWR